MMASEFKLRPPWNLCETIKGDTVHLTIKVPHHQMTACGRTVFDLYYKDKKYDRPMCKSCLRTIGLVRRAA